MPLSNQEMRQALSDFLQLLMHTVRSKQYAEYKSETAILIHERSLYNCIKSIVRLEFRLYTISLKGCY